MVLASDSAHLSNKFAASWSLILALLRGLSLIYNGTVLDTCYCYLFGMKQYSMYYLVITAFAMEEITYVLMKYKGLVIK